MKRAIVLLTILALLAALTACANGGSPSAAASLSASPSPSPTAAPSPATRTDLPAYFAPGLSAVGALPTQNWRIGFIAGGAYQEAAVLYALQDIAAQYAALGVTVSVWQAYSESAQTDAAQRFVSDGVDLVILCADGERAEVGKICSAAGIPYITMGCRAGTPGQDGYLCSFENDDYLVGVLTGLAVADTLTAKNGAPQGNIGEIVGNVADDSTVLRSAGLRRALSAYPDIRVVCSVTTEGDTAYHAAVNVMNAYGTGALDAIVTQSDADALETLQAALNYSRDELRGFIFSAGGTKDGLTGVWYGEFAQSVEVGTQSGMTALEYAVQYLEGTAEEIPPVVCGVTRAFCGSTSQQKLALAEIIAQMDAAGYPYSLDNQGDYGLFAPDDRLLEIYPKHYYEYGDTAAYLAEFPPFTTVEAVYGTSAE